MKMTERRISGWFVLSAVFIVAMFGLFFTFTERKTWPEQKIELSSADMRLVPPSFILWCESVALYSDHPFVAYQGEGDIESSLRLIRREDSISSNDSESLEDSSEEEGQSMESAASEPSPSYRKLSPGQYTSVISDSEISQSEEENVVFSCEGFSTLRPMQINITSPDFYVIAVINTDQRRVVNVGLRILLDRSRYIIHNPGHTLDMCSLSTACTIDLKFASSDRALVWIPEEPDAGRSTFVIRSQCRPRLAVFAILSVFFPLIVFLAVAFVIRADRDRIRRIYSCRGRTSRNQELGSDTRFVAPLLDDVVAGTNAPTNRRAPEASTVVEEELPPPYDTLCDAPPPYACVKE